MANFPSKGIAQTLQDVLSNLQNQVKEKTVALDAANKKVAALSGDKGGDFTIELNKEKEKGDKVESVEEVERVKNRNEDESEEEDGEGNAYSEEGE